LWFRPRVAPTNAHYRIPFDRRYVSWEEDPEQMASHVTAEYQTTGVDVNGNPVVNYPLTTAAPNVGFLEEYGFQRSIRIDTGEMTDAEALALRDRESYIRSRPIVQSTITLDADSAHAMTTPAGDSVPLYVPRAGQWIDVANRGREVLVGTTVNLSAYSATYELGSYDPALPKNMARVERDAAVRMTRFLATFGGRTRK
jgi:hypothetical protein